MRGETMWSDKKMVFCSFCQEIADSPGFSCKILVRIDKKTKIRDSVKKSDRFLDRIGQNRVFCQSVL